MICKVCKNQIQDGSIFCNWCGQRQIKEHKKSGEIKIPKARQLPSGKWFIQLRAENRSITEDTEALCIAKARAIRAGFIAASKKQSSKTVGDALGEYINSRSNIVSPSTLRTYTHIQKYRFASIMGRNIGELTLAELQSALNTESADIAPKTLRNAWGLLKSAIKPYSALDFSAITLPAARRSKAKVCEPDVLRRLFEAVRGDDIELAVLLAACLGLRRSEILALTRESFDMQKGTVTISAARVPDANNNLVTKTTKTEKSMRVLPCPEFIMSKVPDKPGYIYAEHKQNYLLERLKRICAANDLPDITLHGLRHTNASVMLSLNVPDKYAMERGGWSNNQTMKNIYQHTVSSERAKVDKAVNDYFSSLISEPQK